VAGLRFTPSVVSDAVNCSCVVTDAGESSSILSAVTSLKSSLAYFIEPDFGLVEELLRLEVLDPRQLSDVRSERTDRTTRC